ncbi:MAG: DUF1778 domain-containing protein [Planctomycetes bacterium]|nr:DUF1778 domain-containing protein [Planctomycetota bacterium]
MSIKRSANKAGRATKTTSLVIRFDQESRSCLARAAELRQISVSEYVRTVAVAQARCEVEGTVESAIVLTPEEQLAFWSALNRPPKLSPAQKRLGKLMRGET